MCKGQQQELKKPLEKVKINVTAQAVEQKENVKTTGYSAAVKAMLASARSKEEEQHKVVIQRMGETFEPINARRVLPDAEVVQTSGKSNYKIKKEKKKIAKARNSIADDVSYDLKLQANRQLTAVHPAVNSVIQADHIDMANESNVYRCAIAEAFMKETENEDDKLFLRNFLSNDADTRFVAFHQMMESIRNIEISQDELTPEYMLSHLEEFQNIIMRVRAFENYSKEAEKNEEGTAGWYDREFFSSLSKEERSLLSNKVEMGIVLETRLESALMQKGLHYVQDEDSPFGAAENWFKYLSLFQNTKVDYNSRENAKNDKKGADRLMKQKTTGLEFFQERIDGYTDQIRDKGTLTSKVKEKVENAPLPPKLSERVQNADAAAQLREMFQRDDVKAYFQAGVEASNKDLEAHKNDSALSRTSSARLKLGLRSGTSFFKDAMRLAFKGMNESMQEYFNSLRLNCVDIDPMLQKVEKFGLGDASFGCGIQEISKGFFKIFREFVLSPAGIELCRNMSEQMSGAKVFYKDEQPDLNAFMQDMYTNFTNAFFAAAFFQYKGTYQNVAIAAQNVMMKSLTYVPEDRTLPEQLPEEYRADVSDIVSSFRNLTGEVVSRF